MDRGTIVDLYHLKLIIIFSFMNIQLIKNSSTPIINKIHQILKRINYIFIGTPQMNSWLHIFVSQTQKQTLKKRKSILLGKLLKLFFFPLGINRGQTINFCTQQSSFSHSALFAAFTISCLSFLHHKHSVICNLPVFP